MLHSVHLLRRCNALEPTSARGAFKFLPHLFRWRKYPNPLDSLLLRMDVPRFQGSKSDFLSLRDPSTSPRLLDLIKPGFKMSNLERSHPRQIYMPYTRNLKNIKEDLACSVRCQLGKSTQRGEAKRWPLRAPRKELR